MKKIFSIIAACFLIALGVNAQSQDSLLIRQLELERDFNPTLLESNKINSLPTLREPEVKKANTNYSTWNVNAVPPLEISIPRPGSINTTIPYSTEKGYIYFNGGNYANMDGKIGYRILDNESDNLTINFFHNSTNGNLNYIQTDGEGSRNTKAKLMDNMGIIRYTHQFDKFALNTHASYLHSSFNYYGNTMGVPKNLEDNNQQVGIFNFKLGLDPTKDSSFEYKGFLDFKNFTNKYGQTLLEDPLKGSQIEAMVGFMRPYNNKSGGVGIDGTILNAYYNNDHKNYLLVGAKPYINFEGLDWNARLGADVLFHIVGKTEIRVVPNVQLRYAPLYLNVKGGYDSNTFVDMFEESRYILPTNIVKPAFSIVDIELGAKITNLDGFRFDVFGGFKKTDDEHFLILNNYLKPETSVHRYINNEFLAPKYADLSHSHIGARVQSTIWSPLNVAVSLKKNFYSIKEDSEAKAWNKPGFEADIRADLSIIDNFKFSLNYYLATDRWSYYASENIKMDNINDLSLGAIYLISDKFSINLNANNILAQKYDIWYGYPAQGLNIIGGFSFKF